MKKKKNGPEQKIFKKPIKTSKIKKNNQTEVKASRIINKYMKNTKNKGNFDNKESDSEKKLEKKINNKKKESSNEESDENKEESESKKSQEKKNR